MQLLPDRFSRLLTLSIAITLCGALAPPVRSQDGLFDEPADDSLGDDSLGGDVLGGSDQPTTQEELKAMLDSELAQAQQLMDQGNWSGALEMLSKGIAYRDPRALISQGTCYKELGANELAINSFSTAYSLLANPSNQAAFPGLMEKSLLERGKLFLETGRARDAADDFGQVRGSDPTSAEANFWTGKALLRKVVSSVGATEQSAQAELMSAAQALEKAIGLDNSMGEAYLERARVLARLRMFDLSVTDLEQAVRLLGANSDAGAELGVALTTRAQQELRQPTPDMTSVLSDLRRGIESFDGYLKNAELGKKKLPWETVDQLKPQAERIFVHKMDAVTS
ncbi:MAG: tetratricopeptide repeat protein, partial [Planctomycetales bacterium]|nr:tetratricopeptide repeat protein [Planctomycetales bacterium]